MSALRIIIDGKLYVYTDRPFAFSVEPDIRAVAGSYPMLALLGKVGMIACGEVQPPILFKEGNKIVIEVEL